MRVLNQEKLSVFGFLIASLGLYAFGIYTTTLVPAHIEAMALPFDFMVTIPAGFYLLVVRPRKLSPLLVIPVIWLGYALSSIVLGSAEVGILPYLLAALLPLELAITVRECGRIARVFKESKAASTDPMVWFDETVRHFMHVKRFASVMAAEMSIWYYVFCSWRKKPYVGEGEKAFTYHNAGGYMNMMLGLAIVLPVEVIGVHLLLSQWSVVAAIIVTMLSVYAAAWIVGDARARVMRPIVVGEDAVRLECGIQMEVVVPLADIESITFAEAELSHFGKSEKLNYGTFYQPNVWVVAKHPIEVRTLLGAKRVRAIGLSVDDSHAFAQVIQESTNA